MQNFYRQKSNNLNVITDELNKEDSTIHEFLKIPVLQGNINPEILNNINTNIRNDILEFKDQLEASAKENAKENQSLASNYKPWEISNNYLVTYNKNGIFSISLIFQELINGKSSFIRTSYNYDLKTGKPLPLESLFKPGTDYIRFLNKEILKQLEENISKYSSNSTSNFKGITSDHPYYLDNNSLNLFFGFNEIAPTSSGIAVIKIPYEDLDSILNLPLTRENFFS
jgi:hypothetical protein